MFSICGTSPKLLQWLNSVGWLTFFACLFTAISGLCVNGALLAAISTIEKRFNFSSTESGLILTSYDIGYLVMCIPLEIITRKFNIGRTLGTASLFISVSALMFVIPHFGTANNSEVWDFGLLTSFLTLQLSVYII